MTEMLKTFTRRLFCRHAYQKIDFRQVTGQQYRWSERQYRCDTCGKTRWVDGRLDPHK